MTRSLDAALVTDLAVNGDTAIATLLALDFGVSGVLRFATAPRDLSWNTYTWSALGGALEIGAPSEATDLDAQGIELRLSGVELSALALLLSETYRGRLAQLWYGHWNPATGAVVGTPMPLFSGYLNAAIEVSEDRGDDEGGGTATITTRITSPLAVLRQRRGIRCNVDDHHAANAYALTNNDPFFQHVANMAIQSVKWGSINADPTYGSSR